MIPGTEKLFYSINGAAFVEQTLVPLGGNLYEATLPGAQCTDNIRYYVQAEAQGGLGVFFDPPDAPLQTYSVVVAIGTEVIY